MNRIQLSLMISDDELYKNLLVKAKESRELHQLTISLYKAYYYNSEVRNLVNNIGNARSEESEEGVSDVISQMRNNLAMQTFLLNDVANTLEGGVEDIKEAYEKGSSVPVGPNSEIKFTQTPQGNTGVKLIQTRNSEISEETSETKQIATPMSSGLTMEEVQAFREMLAIFRQQPSNLFNSINQEASSQIVESENSQDEEKTSSLIENSQDTQTSTIQTVENTENIQDDTSSASDEDTEALDLLDDLLGSLN